MQCANGEHFITSLQHGTLHTSFFFHRLPRLPEVSKACPMGETIDIGDPEEDIDTRVKEITALNEKILKNIEKAQTRQQRSYGNRKRKLGKTCTVNVGDSVLISENPKKQCLKPSLASRHQGLFTVSSISSKGVATVMKDDEKHHQLSVSRLRPYYSLENRGATKDCCLQDHRYWMSSQANDHPYACLGDKWEKDLGPFQDELASALSPLHYCLINGNLIVVLQPACSVFMNIFY
ncbi:uncharacterized protein LOC127526655 [Erpetoichthys calabaricus]|uniref:uncharacterized protein LOC127526655 n=1 Tax=Erpetoichthys calabaricus TaxID=27687 RepID=UPI0022343A41|nr:uncharacterized protein LOC127526655 [Erpetoichthys calabaricus]